MLRLLEIELHKLLHNRASRNLTIIYFLLLTSIALIAAIKFDFGPVKFHLAEQGIFDFPFIWHFNTFIAATAKFFLLLVIVSMMANEYSYRTLKQNLIDGLSKKEFILSKFYTVVLFALISTAFVFIISLILGLIYSDYNEFGIIITDLSYIFAFFIKLVGFFSFGLFLGILIKRSAFAVAAMIVWFIAEQVTYGFIRWKSDQYFAQSIKDFFPLEAMYNLIIEPFTRLSAVKTISQQVGEEIVRDYSVSPLNVLVVLAWSALFIYGSYALLKKRDL